MHDGPCTPGLGGTWRLLGMKLRSRMARRALWSEVLYILYILYGINGMHAVGLLHEEPCIIRFTYLMADTVTRCYHNSVIEYGT